MNDSHQHFGFAVTIAIEGLKSLLLLNGGAATALIALTDKSLGDLKYGPAIVFFGFGALLAVIAMVTGYFSQLAYANHLFANENKRDPKPDYTKHGHWQRISIGVVVLSLAASIAGMFEAYDASRRSSAHTQVRLCGGAPCAPLKAAPGAGSLPH